MTDLSHSADNIWLSDVESTSPSMSSITSCQNILWSTFSDDFCLVDKYDDGCLVSVPNMAFSFPLVMFNSWKDSEPWHFPTLLTACTENDIIDISINISTLVYNDCRSLSGAFLAARSKLQQYWIIHLICLYYPKLLERRARGVYT